MHTYQHWIDGAFVNPASGQWLDTIDPYQGKPWAKIPRGNAEDGARAVAAAKRAMDSGPWGKITATERGKILRRIKRSGFGRETGIESVREFLETKSVFVSTAATPPANPFVYR